MSKIYDLVYNETTASHVLCNIANDMCNHIRTLLKEEKESLDKDKLYKFNDFISEHYESYENSYDLEDLAQMSVRANDIIVQFEWSKYVGCGEYEPRTSILDIPDSLVQKYESAINEEGEQVYDNLDEYRQSLKEWGAEKFMEIKENWAKSNRNFQQAEVEKKKLLEEKERLIFETLKAKFEPNT